MSLGPGLWGFLDDALRWSCGYGANPTDPPCMNPAKWHGLVVRDNELWRDGAFACCDAHVTYMRRHATYVHEMGSACFLPNSTFSWPENYCATPDEGVESLTEAAPLHR